MATVFQQTLEAIESLKGAQSPEQVCSRLTGFTEQFGLTGMIAGTMPLPNDPPKRQASHLLASGFPPDWMTRYVSRSYFKTDPVIRRIQSDIRPFDWRDTASYIDDSNRAEASVIFGEAGEFGLRAGFAVPMITLEGEIAAVSLCGTSIEMPPTAPGMVAMVSNFAIARAIELRSCDSRRAQASLSPREVECLRWTAQGKTQWEISVILSVSEHTIETHLKNVSRKLSAHTRAHAVAEGFRLRLID